ncbi:MAG TPA: hypothetical protein VHG28_03240 [Longimicrobiaceae bacterium]|nr:hypothetical protein [Longimicrobiaceae bacterium]
MPNPLSNRKKVRGWKRRLRQLDRFQREHQALNLDALCRNEVAYVKLWLDPWSRLVPRNPPVWFRRRVLHAFLEILRSWHRALEVAGEPYYLRLWLFHPRFYQTQVVAAVGDRIEYYETLFVPDDRVRTLPPPQYEDPSYDLRLLEWRPCLDTDVILPEDTIDMRELARPVVQASRIETASTGQALLLFNRGRVWLGSLPRG